uniref:Uncharacterized protein n=1 Tax=Rhizophora mucronata TaxID=61149 RepID=A0A2P2NLP4_RHIMU
MFVAGWEFLLSSSWKDVLYGSCFATL